MSRHTENEVFDLGKRDLTSLSDFLGDKPFVDADAAEKAAIACEKSARGYKKDQSGLFGGDEVRTRALHVDCRLGYNFLSLGVFNAAPGK
jgi:hypothetical protein